MFQSNQNKVEKFTICIPFLPPQTNEVELKNYFHCLSPLKAGIAISKENNLRGYVDFSTKENRDNAINIYDGKEFKGMKIKVKAKHENRFKNNKNNLQEDLLLKNQQKSKFKNNTNNSIVPINNNNHFQHGSKFPTISTGMILQKTITCQIIEEKKKKYLKYSIHFALDSSGSMAGSRWNSLVDCFKNFVESRKKRKANDLISITLYNDKASTVCETLPILKNDFSDYMNHLGGGTNFAAALKEVHKVMSKRTHPKRKPVLVFLSDGEDDSGDAEMQNLIKEFKDLKVFVIGFCTTGEEKLLKLAKIGKGQYCHSSKEINLKSVFTQIKKYLTETETTTSSVVTVKKKHL